MNHLNSIIIGGTVEKIENSNVFGEDIQICDVILTVPESKAEQGFPEILPGYIRVRLEGKAADKALSILRIGNLCQFTGRIVSSSCLSYHCRVSFDHYVVANDVRLYDEKT